MLACDADDLFGIGCGEGDNTHNAEGRRCVIAVSVVFFSTTD